MVGKLADRLFCWKMLPRQDLSLRIYEEMCLLEKKCCKAPKRTVNSRFGSVFDTLALKRA